MSIIHVTSIRLRTALTLLIISTILLGFCVSADTGSIPENVAGEPGNIVTQNPGITVTLTAPLLPPPVPEVTPASSSAGTLLTRRTAERSVDEYALMHLSPAQIKAKQDRMNAAPAYSAPKRNLLKTGSRLTGSHDVFSYLNYTPAERDQGYCGNCWVWAATGALEVEHAAKNNVKDRLSVQYFNSRYMWGEGGSWACCGGFTSEYTDWLTLDGAIIPWSNFNASYGDYYSVCERYASATPMNTLGYKPDYHMNSLSTSLISTTGVSQATAIANIKSALDNNRAVVYGYYLGSGGWNDFVNFWDHDNETVAFDMVPHNGEVNDGGHAVLIVGYNDTDPSNPYWVVLNSWGTTAKRQNGLFRLNMSMNYSATIFAGGDEYWQHEFELVNADFTVPEAILNGTPRSGTAPLTVTFMDYSNSSPITWNWSFGDGNFSELQDPVHTYGYPGTFTVTLNATNTVGSNSTVRKNYVIVRVPRPVPAFATNVTSGMAPLSVAFTDQSAGSPSEWAWFFGDEDYTQAWTVQNASPGWSGREGHTTVTLPDGSIVLMGGTASGTSNNETWRSTDNGATWTLQNPSSGWLARYGHTSVVSSDGSILLMGGYARPQYAGSGVRLNDTWKSTDKGVTWTLENASSGWPARSRHSSVALSDDSIIIMGGDLGSSTYANDTWRSTDNGATWKLQNPSSGWTRRYWFGSTALSDDSIIIMGGDVGSASLTNDTWKSTDKGVTWTRQNASSGWLPRRGFSSIAMPDSSMVLSGGSYTNINLLYSNDTWRSTDKGVSWTRVNASSGWPERHDYSSVPLTDGSIVLLGGYSLQGGEDTLFNDTWRLDPTGSSLQNPVHTYTKAGTYKVSQQVFNGMNFNSTRRSGAVVVTPPAVPAVTAFASGYAAQNTTVNFTVTGTNFDAGSGMTRVNFTKGAFSNNNVTLSSVTPTKINGTMIIGRDAPDGTWDMRVTTVNGGTSAVRTSAITVNRISAPTIAAFSPAGGFRNTTVNFTLTGTNFQTGTGQTRVRVYEDFMDTELDAAIISVTPTKVLGSIAISGNAIPGSYILEVNTVDGGSVSKSAAFSVGYSQIPAITTISPATGFRNDTVPYTITGTGFQPGLTTVTFRNQTTNTILGTSEVASVTTTKITGNLTIPAAVPTGSYRLDIITVDGGVVNKRDAFRVTTVPPPVIAALTPASGAKGGPVAFTLTGANFMLNDKTSVTVLDDTTGTELKTSILSLTPTKIIGSFTIPATAPSGKYRLQVRTTDGGTVNKYDAFMVTYLGLPVITSLNPTTGSRNTNVTFTLKGNNFASGDTIVRMRMTGTTINATALSVNTTVITGEFPISTTAGIGSYRLDVITGAGGISNKQNAFSVKAV